MYMNLNELKRLKSIKTNINNEHRHKKLIDRDLYDEVDRWYKPVIEPLKAIADMPAPILSIPTSSAITPILPAIEESKNIPPIQSPVDVPALEPIKYDTLQLGVLADRYLKTPANLYDHAYGIKPVEGSVNFRLGRMDVKIQRNDFIIDDEHYEGTEGLWRLLTLREPGVQSADDMETYKRMMLKTKAFLKENSNHVKCNRGSKYKNIIKPIADEYKSTPYSTPLASPIHARSSPLSTIQNSSTPQLTPLVHADKKRRRFNDYTGTGVVYIPSDPNELVDRHRILFGAFNAGNTGVFNEINAINDKLLELGIFDTNIIQRLNRIINAEIEFKPE